MIYSSKYSTKNIARIAKRCPENITLFVKCFKLLFPKVLRKRKEKRSFLRGCAIFLTTVTTVTAFTTVTITILFDRVIWHIWQPMWCSQGRVLQFSLELFHSKCNVIKKVWPKFFSTNNFALKNLKISLRKFHLKKFYSKSFKWNFTLKYFTWKILLQKFHSKKFTQKISL